MYNNHGRRRGTATATATKQSITTTTVKPVQAKNAANQDACDRLLELVQNAGQSNFFFTAKRAMNSVRDCEHAITTIAEALQLKFVGDRLSHVIVPSAAAKTAPVAPLNSKVPTTTTSGNGNSSGVGNTKTKRLRQTSLSTAVSAPAASANATTNALPHSVKERAYEKAKKEAEELVLPKGPWKVILLVDIREHKSKNVVSKCQQSGIPCEERLLPIGDMAWIAQCPVDGGAGGGGGVVEVLVGTILERKEVNDLAGSLFGTRFLEQRLRLYHCGVPQIMYLVEGDLGAVANCSAETLRMAMMETRVQLGFSVLQTKHLEDTVRVLKGLHRRIVQRAFPNDLDELPIFAGRHSDTGPRDDRGRKRRRPSSLLEMVFDSAHIPPFQQHRFTTYAELKAKVERDREAGTKTVGAIFQAMLKQVPTLSQKKCQAIATEYPTWNRLLQAYDEVVVGDSPKNGDIDKNNSSAKPQTALLVKDVPSGRQKVGPKSAAELDLVCCVQRDGSLMTDSKVALEKKLKVSRSTLAATTTAGSTTTGSTSSNTAMRPSSTVPSSTVAISNQNGSTRTATESIRSHHSGATDPISGAKKTALTASCLDLTLDSPPPSKPPLAVAAARRPLPTAFAKVLKEPLWCDDGSSSDDNDNSYAHQNTKKPAFDTMLSTRQVATAWGLKTSGMDLSVSSSDDDDDNGLRLSSDEKENRSTDSDSRNRRGSTKFDKKLPATKNQAGTTTMVVDTAISTSRSSNVARLSLDSYGDSTVYFSSPSTTSSLERGRDDGRLSLQNNSSNNSRSDQKPTAKPSGDVSIVVIDSSDDDDDAVKEPPRSSSATTTVFQSSLGSSSSRSTSSSSSSGGGSSSSLGTPGDLRSRLAKRIMDRETIEID